LTLIASFRYRFSPVRIERNTALAFYAGRPYPGGTPTRALVTIRDGRNDVVVYDEPLPLADAKGMKWKRHTIDLRRFAGRNVAITFGAEATGGDQTAAWAAFGYPSLVAGGR
jgi:hypothetical protein